MKFKDLLDELDTLELPRDKYAITSSGTLAVRDIRKAQDIDIVVTDDLWDELAEKYEVHKGKFWRIDVGNIQVLGKGSIYTDPKLASTKKQIEEADVIDGRRYVNLETVKKFKKALGREKDQKDIKLIEQYLKGIAVFKDKKYRVAWIRDDDLSKYEPVSQVYGVVFNNKDEILVVRRNSHSMWQIPGGTPDEGESWEEALARELEEEANVTVKNIVPLGAQKVVLLDGNNDNPAAYQLRYIARLDELLPQVPDPDSGEIWERKFVPAEKINEVVTWGRVGKALFEDAVEVYYSNKKLIGSKNRSLC
jgi:ADP-ribose pyrophosphatase YjhB (NUDIX family)